MGISLAKNQNKWIPDPRQGSGQAKSGMTKCAFPQSEKYIIPAKAGHNMCEANPCLFKNLQFSNSYGFPERIPLKVVSFSGEYQIAVPTIREMANPYGSPKAMSPQRMAITNPR